MNKVKIFFLIIILILVFFIGKKCFLMILVRKKIEDKVFITSSNYYGLKENNGIFIIDKSRTEKITDESIISILDYDINNKVLKYIIYEDGQFYLITYKLGLNEKIKQYINLESIYEKSKKTIISEKVISHPVIYENDLVFIFDEKIYKYNFEKNELLFLMGDIKEDNALLLNEMILYYVTIDSVIKGYNLKTGDIKTVTEKSGFPFKVENNFLFYYDFKKESVLKINLHTKEKIEVYKPNFVLVGAPKKIGENMYVFISGSYSSELPIITTKLFLVDIEKKVKIDLVKYYNYKNLSGKSRFFELDSSLYLFEQR